MTTAVYLDAGKSRVFACAYDWPGWARRGRDEDDALRVLADYADRYVPIVEAGGLTWPKGATTFEVVGRRHLVTPKGYSNADFGALDGPTERDSTPPTKKEAERLVAIVEASWRFLDRTVAGAPAELRKGPRGGGRDRDKVAQHVIAAEQAFARKIGVKVKEPAYDDAPAVADMRRQIAAALVAARDAPDNGWPVRYAARRIAWHVLDHAWEIEDRSV